MREIVEQIAKNKLADAAFPIILDERGIEIAVKGLTKREWFAGMVIQGMLANPSYGWTAKGAVEIVDAVIKELEKNGETKISRGDSVETD